MGDVAQILGTAPAKGGIPPPPLSNVHQPSRAMKLSGMPSKVVQLLSGKQDSYSAALPPIVPTFTEYSENAGREKNEASVKVGNRWISSSKPSRKWTWAPFVSSSRTDGAMFRHWVRSNVEYTDYPYAKFDIHLDAVTYTDDEYKRLLESESWTKSETDKLMEIARKYELRWAVIHDRWVEYCHSQESDSPAHRKIEELQHRYYSVAAMLAQSRLAQEAAAEAQELSTTIPPTSGTLDDATENLLMETAAAKAIATAMPQNQPLVTNLGTGSSNKMFDLDHERERRARLDELWNRSKKEEFEEMELRKELRLIEAQLRKLKKTGGHILAATNSSIPGAVVGASSKLSSATSFRNPSPMPGATSNILDSAAVLDQCFSSTAPTPMARTPYLQSGRLLPPATGGSLGLNKSLLARMDAVLLELKIRPRPIPTKRVCDVYDAVRKDILTLLTLQKMLLHKEGSLQAKRLKLAKMGGGGPVFDEEALLGISNPPPAVTPAASATPPQPAKPSGGKAARPSGKAKVAPSTTGKSALATGKTAPTTAKTAPTTPKAASTPAASKAKAPVSKPKAAGDPTKPDAKETPGGDKKPKTATKRKRKAETKPAAPVVAGGVVPVTTAVAPATAPVEATKAGPPPTTPATAKPSAKPSATKAATAKPAAKPAATAPATKLPIAKPAAKPAAKPVTGTETVTVSTDATKPAGTGGGGSKKKRKAA
jgi:DNA methyltransferase 1-associated protein 1